MILILLAFLFIVLCVTRTPARENFQEMFGYSGFKEPVTSTYIDYGGDYSITGFTDVTASHGINNNDVQVAVKATQEFIKKQLNMCSYPVETSKMLKFVKGSDVIFRCNFMFMVTSTSYPFVLGIDIDVKNGSVTRATTQDIYQGRNPSAGLEDNFRKFSEIESFNVYSR